MKNAIRNTQNALRKKTAVVILAAGLGKRMKSGLPKVLHQLGSDTVMGRVLAAIEKIDISRPIVVVGHKAESVKSAFGKRAQFVRQEKLLGSADALKCAMGGLPEEVNHVLVSCGDTPLISARVYEDLVKTHIAGKAACTFLSSRVADPASYGRILRDARGRVTRVVEERDASSREKAINEINVGTYCFKRGVLDEYLGRIKVNEKKKEFYLTDIIGILAKGKKKLLTRDCPADEAIGINSRRDLAAAMKIMNKKNIERLMDAGVTIIDMDTTFIDETAEIGEDTVIFPDTIIEGNVSVGKACRIGPFARLRPGTRIADEVEIGNFVEVCRSRIGKGTKVKHHSYLGDAIVGENVNIGAGTITANYDGRAKHRTVIEDEVFTGVGAVLIAPVKIGKGARVGAGSVVTKNKDVPEGQTVVGVPARLLIT